MKIRVFSTPSCPYCSMLKDFLREHNIEFEDINVAEDREMAREMISKSGQMGVPQIFIEKDGREEIVVGFNKERLMQILNISE